MKKLMLLSAAILGMLFSSCYQTGNVEAMLENENTRSKIYSAIMEDDEMMVEFMDQMAASEHGMDMMRGHKGMMDHMMHDGYVKTWMKENTEARGQMVEDGQMMGMMMQMMHQKGMMSDECLQATMQMMKDHGMDVDEMGMQNSSS